MPTNYRNLDTIANDIGLGNRWDSEYDNFVETADVELVPSGPSSARPDSPNVSEDVLWYVTVDDNNESGAADESLTRYDQSADAWEVGGSGSSVTIDDDGTTVVDPADIVDFAGSDFDVTAPNSGEAKVTLTDDSLTVAGNSVSLGGSTGIGIGDLTGALEDSKLTNSGDVISWQLGTKAIVLQNESSGSPLLTINYAGDITFNGLQGDPTFSGHNHAGSGTSSIPNSGLDNSVITVTSGDGLKNGGSINLGGSTTLDIKVADFAGTGLTDDGNDNLQINVGDISHDQIDQTTVTQDDHHKEPSAGTGITDEATNQFGIADDGVGPTQLATNSVGPTQLDESQGYTFTTGQEVRVGSDAEFFKLVGTGPSVNIGMLIRSEKTKDWATINYWDSNNGREQRIQFKTTETLVFNTLKFSDITGTPTFASHDHSEGGMTAIPSGGIATDAVGTDELDQSAAFTWTSTQTFSDSAVALSIDDQAADPANNGEVARNGSDVKVKSGGAVRNLSNIGSGSDTRTDISDDGSSVVTDTDDINFTDGVEVTDDGDGSVSVNTEEPVSYDPGMTNWEDGLSDEEIWRLVLQSGETLVVDRIEFRQKGGGSSTSASIDVRDTTAATTIGSQNLGGTTKDPGSSGSGNTVIVRVNNSTGGAIDAAPRVVGSIQGA